MKRVGIGAAIAVALYAALGFLVVPPVARAQLLKRLPLILHREVALRQVRFNPFALSLTLRDFAVREKDGSNFVSFAELYVNVAFLRLLIGQIRLEEISLVQPRIDVALLRGGRLSFADLLEGDGKPKPKSSGPPPRIFIERLRIEAGELGFADLSRAEPFRAHFAPIALALDNLSTAPDANSPYTFTARMDPSTVFRWKGDLSATPFRSAGVVEIEGLALAAFAPYLREQTQLEVRSGTLGIKLDYRVDASKDALVAALEGGSIRVADLAVGAPGRTAPIFALPTFSLDGLRFDLGERRASIASIALDGGAVEVVRGKDGVLEWAALAQPPAGKARAAPAPAAAAKPENAAPFRVELGGLKLSRFTIDVEDREPAQPGKLRVSDLSLAVGKVAHPSDAPIDLALALRLNGAASLSIKGQARLSGAADVEVALDKLALPWLQPWVRTRANAVLARGQLSLQGKAHFAPRPKGEPELAFDGALQLDQLSIAGLDSDKELAGWDALAVTGIAFRGAPQSLRIDKIALAGPRGHAVKSPAGALNLAGLAKASPAQPAAKPAEPKPADAAPLALSIGSIAIDRGAFDYTDRSLTPAFAVRIAQLKARAQPLAWPAPARTRLELTGRLDAAPFALRGELRPRGKQADGDATITLKGWDLPPTSSYSIKYTGYPVTKGKLSLDLNYKIEQRRLAGANHVLIDQPTLGDRLDVEGATHLPVKLALALLTDRHGALKVDLPVSGNLDDPSFAMGGVIVAALVNLLEKVATSPFALLGGLFGGDEDPGSVEFEAGVSDLGDKERARLDKLAQALGDRPALKLEVIGAVDAAADRAALALIALRERLQQRAGAAGKRDDAEEYARRVRVAWRELQPPARAPAGQPAAGQATPAAAPAEPPLAEMERALVANERVPDEELQSLADERAREVQEHLLEKKGIEPERVFVVVEKLDASTGKPRATLKLQ